MAEVHVKFPDELTFAQGSIWVKTDDGHLVQINPSTNGVDGDIRVDTTTNRFHYCQGLGSDGEDIWACSASGVEGDEAINVVRVDPQSLTVTATYEVDKVFDQFNMPFFLGQVWVLTEGGSRLVGIDATTNRPGPAIDLGTRCFQVAPAGNSLLVTCKLDNLILRVDPLTMEVTQRKPISAPWNIVANEDGVWVGQANAVVRLDPESLDPVVAFTGLPGADLFATEAAIWVRLDQGFLYRIDPVSNELVEQISSDLSIYSMGGVLVTPDAIWTSAGDNDLLLRLALE